LKSGPVGGKNIRIVVNEKNGVFRHFPKASA